MYCNAYTCRMNFLEKEIQEEELRDVPALIRCLSSMPRTLGPSPVSHMPGVAGYRRPFKVIQLHRKSQASLGFPTLLKVVGMRKGQAKEPYQ